MSWQGGRSRILPPPLRQMARAPHLISNQQEINQHQQKHQANNVEINKRQTKKHISLINLQTSGSKRRNFHSVWNIREHDRLCWFHFERIPMDTGGGWWVGHFKDALWSSIAATLLSSASLCALTQLFSTCLPTCLPKKYFIRFPGNKQDFLILWHQLCRKWILDNSITRGLKFWIWQGSNQVRQTTLLPPGRRTVPTEPLPLPSLFKKGNFSNLILA